MNEGRITVTFLNAIGTGFANRIPVNEGTTVGQFIEDRGIDASTLEIRLQRGPAGSKYTPAAHETLKDGDILTATASKGEGA